MKFVLIGRTGNDGKTTMARQLLFPLLPRAYCVSIEDYNQGDGEPDLEIGAKSFMGLAADLNVSDNETNFIIDIGSSNCKLMTKQFSQLKTTAREIDWWVIPVSPHVKQMADAMSTVADLLENGIEPNKIIVLPNMIVDPETYDTDFAEIAAAARQSGFTMSPVPVLFDEVYGKVKGQKLNLFEIAGDHTDLKAMRKQFRDDPDKMREIGEAMVLKDAAAFVCVNLLQVFMAMPFAAELSCR